VVPLPDMQEEEVLPLQLADGPELTLLNAGAIAEISVKGPEREGALWALDYVTKGRLLPHPGGEVGAVEPEPPVPAPEPPPAPGPAVPPPALDPQAAPAAAPPADADQPAEPAKQYQQWTPELSGSSTADGVPPAERHGPLFLDGCAGGALIGKIGGSSADLKPDKEKVLLFGAGRHCVFSVADGKEGSLYLGINDTAASAGAVKGPSMKHCDGVRRPECASQAADRCQSIEGYGSVVIEDRHAFTPVDLAMIDDLANMEAVLEDMRERADHEALGGDDLAVRQFPRSWSDAVPVE
jgi:hypothetical protein